MSNIYLHHFALKSNKFIYIIKDILNVLCLIELLEIQADTELSDNGGYKTIFKVVKMRDSVTDKVAEALEARRVKNLDK